MNIFQFDTSSEAYFGIIRAFLTNQDGIIQGKAGLRTWAHDVIIKVRKPDMSIDFSSVGFSPRRWGVFLDHYFEAAPFSTFYQRIVHGRPVQEAGYSCPVNAPHTMGNCLLGLTAHTKPLRVSLHSRACVWAPTGLLDLSFASVLVQNLQRDLGSPTGSIVWHIDQLQLNAIKSLPILYEMGVMPDIIEGKYNYSPFGKLTYYEYHKLEKTINSPYKTYRRYAKKMEKLANGERPKPFSPTLPDNFRLASIDKLPGKLTLIEIAEEIEVPIERVRWSARQMGLPFQDKLEIQFDLTDPKIQHLITILKHRKSMRGVGG